MTKSPTADVKRAIKKARALFWDRFRDKPEEVNRGKCDLFAEEVALRVDRVVVVGDPGRHVVGWEEVPVRNPSFQPSEEPAPEVHAWIYDPKSKRHFSAEAPDGVTDWRKLPFYDGP